jgi:hypothetical protein
MVEFLLDTVLYPSILHHLRQYESCQVQSKAKNSKNLQDIIECEAVYITQTDRPQS